jgi:SAM-dependent MidA family methyltransferase
MEQALYHPEHGYYSSGRAQIGRGGDYFTNVSVGPLFGRLLASQFEEIWERLGAPDEFTIVEQGAHKGDFAHDVLSAVRENSPEFFAALRYEIVEPFALLHAIQAKKLHEFGSTVAWSEALDQLASFSGIHFSNELLDALPVHLIATNNAKSGWLEKFVSDTPDGFVWSDGPLSSAELAAHVRKLPQLPNDYETEANLAALNWIEQLSAKLERGFVLAADYGYTRHDFYNAHRATRTLAGYTQHRRVDSPLENVGDLDITAHVNWTSLIERADECGLRLAGFADQHHFMTALATGRMRDAFGDEASPQTRRALQTLLHPNFLGIAFQFVAFAKNMNADALLDGFRFARDR